MWNLERSIAYLNDHAQEDSLGRCAQAVREAIEAGGVTLVRHASAKDYGSSLERAMFRPWPGKPGRFAAGDVAVIQPIPGHPHGHIAMFNGTDWVSDFTQPWGYYPGPSYRAQKPPVAFYRHALLLAAPPRWPMATARSA